MSTQIIDLKELYATFMRLKTNKPQLECTVLGKRKEKVKKNGSRAGKQS